MTTRANILLQNYIEAVWEYRLERDSGNDPSLEEQRMDAAELELTQYIDSLERIAQQKEGSSNENVPPSRIGRYNAT